MRKDPIIKLILLMFGMLMVLGCLASCSPQTMGSRQYPRRRVQGTPRYGKGDTVRQKRSGIWFVIEGVQVRVGSSQVFYSARYMNGIRAEWLPEGVIEKI